MQISSFLSLFFSQVYSIGDLRYLNESDSTLPSMDRMRQHLPFASNLTLNNQSMLTSTLSKLLARVSGNREGKSSRARVIEVEDEECSVICLLSHLTVVVSSVLSALQSLGIKKKKNDFSISRQTMASRCSFVHFLVTDRKQKNFHLDALIRNDHIVPLPI